jgi:hypothetical protein
VIKQAVLELAVFLAVTLLVAFVFDITSDQNSGGLYVMAVVLAVAVTVSSMISGRLREKRRTSAT